MDDITFNRFIDYVTKHIKKDNEIKNLDTKEIITTLYQLRNNQGDFNNYFTESDYNYEINTPTSYGSPCTIGGYWFLGCWVFSVPCTTINQEVKIHPLPIPYSEE